MSFQSHYSYGSLEIVNTCTKASVSHLGVGHIAEIYHEDRRNAAQALAGDAYRVMPISEYSGEGLGTAHAEIDRLNDERDQTITDLGRILDALDLGEHARPESPHEVVEREVLPRIRQLWFKVYHGEVAQPDRPDPADPASVRVGDVVEIVFSGTVTTVDDSPLLPFRLDSGYWPPVTTEKDATVRVLSRAEPEGLTALRKVVRELAAKDVQLGDSDAAERLYQAGMRHSGVIVPEVETDA